MPIASPDGSIRVRHDDPPADALVVRDGGDVVGGFPLGLVRRWETVLVSTRPERAPMWRECEPGTLVAIAWIGAGDRD